MPPGQNRTITGPAGQIALIVPAVLMNARDGRLLIGLPPR
jgi:hypothetical protein